MSKRKVCWGFDFKAGLKVIIPSEYAWGRYQVADLVVSFA